MNKKIILLVLLSSMLLAGCGRKRTVIEVPDGYYHYNNKSWGFDLVLPKEFQYFQTQAKEMQSDFADIEIYVPTSDMAYEQEVPGYAKPIVMRMFKEEVWSKNKDKSFEKIGKKNGRIYAIKFWNKIPKDWEKKWTDDMKEDVLDRIVIE